MPLHCSTELPNGPLDPHMARLLACLGANQKYKCDRDMHALAPPATSYIVDWHDTLTLSHMACLMHYFRTAPLTCSSASLGAIQKFKCAHDIPAISPATSYP